MGYACMPSLDLHFVDELIALRQQQHGGGRGAPPKQNGHRIGASVNRSCIVMLSALLQSYVEDVFQEAAKRTFPNFRTNNAAFEKYWKQAKNWGNPSDVNIINLFMRLGVPDVFDGLTWQRTATADIKIRLGELNQIRNQIAHGSRQLTLNGQPYSLTLAKVASFRNFVAVFGARFDGHIQTKLPSR